MVNKIDVQIAGEKHTLKYDMESLMDFEDRAQVGLPYISTLMFLCSQEARGDNGEVDGTRLMLAFNKKFKTKWAIAAVYCGQLWKEKPMTWDEAKELCQRHGIAALATLFFQIYPVFMRGNEPKKDETTDEKK